MKLDRNIIKFKFKNKEFKLFNRKKKPWKKS